MELKASHSWDPKLEMKTIEALKGVIKLWKLENFPCRPCKCYLTEVEFSNTCLQNQSILADRYFKLYFF